MKNSAVAAALLAGSGIAFTGRNTATQCNTGANNPCWLKWSGWSSCLGECGGAAKKRSRRCRGGLPGLPGTGCAGPEIERRSCPDSSMVGGSYCRYWSFWSDWSPYPGCDVVPSPDPCILNTQGTRTRTRTCEDANAKKQGVAPDCSGLDGENTQWVRDSPTWMQGCTAPGIVYPPIVEPCTFGPWSECTASRDNRYIGVQQRTCQHVCSNTVGTWVDQAEFYKTETRPCSLPICNEGIVQITDHYHTEYPQCFSGMKTIRRTFEGYNEGCLSHAEYQSMTLVTTTGNVKTYEIVTYDEIPVPLPPGVMDTMDPAPLWSGCLPQARPSTWANGPPTTCNFNGKQTRTWIHECTHTCNGNTNCVWNKPPYVITQQRPCGPEPVLEPRNTCHIDSCNPVCTLVSVCDGVDMPNKTISCNVNECGVPAGLWQEPAPCGCNQEFKHRTWYHQCSSQSDVAIECPAHGQKCKYTEVVEAQALVEARNNGQCVCKVWADYYDRKDKQCTSFAENSETCGTVIVDTVTNVNLYASDVCPGEEVCQTCPTTCKMPGQPDAVAQCHNQDICQPGRMIPTRTIPCPQATCCSWTPYLVDIACDNTARCPSTSTPVGREVSRLVDGEGNLCPLNAATTENIRYREIGCPLAPCPGWPDFGAWSACSWILSDGTVCGGNRVRNRDYPCRADVTAGKCYPRLTNGYAMNDGRIDDPYTQIDAASPQHHSQFCWDLYRENSNYVRTVVTSEWGAWVRATENNGCFSGQIKQVRTKTETNRCSGEEGGTTTILTEERFIAIPTCIDDLNSATCNIGYDSNGVPTACSGTISWTCRATDVCGADEAKYRMATAEELVDARVCGLKRVVANVEEGPCQYRGSMPMPIDTCTGQCDRVTTYHCPSVFPAYTEKPMCTLSPRWTTWTGFGACDGRVIDLGRPHVGVFTDENGITQTVDVQCDACGGPQLCSKRMLYCSDPSALDTVVVDERKVDCPPMPEIGWTPWSDCGVSCKKRANDKCIETRTQITQPWASHCFAPKTETREIPIPPCDCPNKLVEQTCINVQDPTANCGMGSTHQIYVYQTLDCVTLELQEERRSEPQLYQDETGARKSCSLTYQPEYVDGNTYGCNSLTEKCTGGQYMFQRCLTCPDGTRPPNGVMWEQCTVQQAGTCPGLPVATPSAWMLDGPDCMLNGCQASKQEVRECNGGIFQDNCECLSFGRQCCQRDPTASVSNDGRFEYRTVGCIIEPVPELREYQDPDCQCGICEIKRCEFNICTQQIDYNTCMIIQKADGFIQTISAWGECQWDLAEGEDRCSAEGYRHRTLTVTCRDNQVVNEVSYDRWEPNWDVQVNSGMYQWNGDLQYNQLSRCRSAEQFLMRETECDYSLDSCSPKKTTTQYRLCDGVERVVKARDTSEDCPVDGEVIVTAWTQCSVECGTNAGTQTRYQYRRCSPEDRFNHESKPCGCPVAYWSDWSIPEGTCQPCGEKVQSQTQSRTCMKPSSLLGWEGVGMDECYGKCNACTPDADGANTYRQIPLDCSTKLEVPTWDSPTCPSGYDLCNVRSVTSKEYWCGNPTGNSRNIPCQDAPSPPASVVSECNVYCGEGTQTVTRYEYCNPTPVITTQKCMGEYGIVVTVEQPWSDCSATCAGGYQERRQMEVCELKTDFVITTKVDRKHCAMWPCTYWGGWSSWSMCSSTCGDGVRLRQRKCEGGAPGTPGCNATMEYYSPTYGAPEVSFMPTENGATHTEACSTGECCEYEWSGWTNCCIESSGLKKRLKFKGNQCTGEWLTEKEECSIESQKSADYNFQQCSSLLQLRNYGASGITTQIIQGQTVTISGQRTQTVGYDINYGRLLNSGTFQIGGYQYKMSLVNGKQTWFIVRDGKEFPQTVETYPYNDGSGRIVYYYKFDTQWFKYSNNQFNPSRIPPYYGATTSSIKPAVRAVSPAPTTYVYSKYTKNTSSQSTVMPSYYKPVASANAAASALAASKAAAAEATAKAKTAQKIMAANAKAVKQNGAQTFKYKPVFNNNMMNSNAAKVAQAALNTVTQIGQQALAGSAANPVKLPAVKTSDEKPKVSMTKHKPQNSMWSNMWG